MITPPICLATFTAMALADSELWPTGIAGMRFGIIAYVIPFVFVFYPELVMKGSFINIILAVITAAMGVAFLSIGCSGYIFKHLSWLPRVIFIITGISMMPAPNSWFNMILNLVAAGGATLLLLFTRFNYRQVQMKGA